MPALRRDRPGYQYRKRANGSLAHYWNPRRATKKAPKFLGLKPIADDATDAEIAALCNQWTDELLADLQGTPAPVGYDGTIGSLFDVYRTDEFSPYQALKASSRKRDYDPALKFMGSKIADIEVSSLRGDDFRRWHRKWSDGGRVHRAHNCIRKLRAVLSYGLQQKLEGCALAREILSLIEFDAPAPRKVKMDYAHARAIVDKAFELGRPSIALTQALQWDTALRRIDLIGEWLPAKDGEGGIVRGKTRWQGPSVSVISADLILTIGATSKTGAESVHDLKLCPLTLSVLERVALPPIGPLVVSETTKRPYRENYYAADWREIAKKAGVPDTIWSMDSRAGAISEAEAATGNVDAARKLATHTNVKTTLRYVRNSVLDANRETARARQNKRG